MSVKETLFRLCEAQGVSGRRGAAQKAAAQELSKYCQEVTVDKNGNVIGRIRVEHPEKHILLDAHLDQIGLVVTSIDGQGFLHVAPCGGMDRRVLMGSPMTVWGKEPLCGIVCCLPPHLTDGEEKIPPVDELCVDIGLTKQQAEELVTAGDVVTFSAEPKRLLGECVTSPALDNRAGAAAVIESARLLSKEELSCNVTFLLSDKEETNTGGAKTAAFSLYPDEAVMVDVSFATQPSVAPEKAAALGKGTMIGISPSLSKEVSDTLAALAGDEEIPHQFEVMGGATGTNADAVTVTRAGIRTGLLSIPQRNMHTSAEVVDLSDIKSTARLLAAYVIHGGVR